MDFISILAGIFLLSVFVFLVVERPYYLVGLFLFLHLYMVNFELPLPLDSRGLISVVLFLRLVIFDKSNLNLLKELPTNSFILLLLLFTFYSVSVFLLSESSLFMVLRTTIINFVALLLGFITVRRGYGMKVIVPALLITGFLSSVDLIFTYFVSGRLAVVRIIDLLIGRDIFYNHNFFGTLCGQGLIITIILLIYRKISKQISFILIVIFSLGILISTSRMNILTTIVTLFILLLVQNEYKISFKRVASIGFAGILLIVFVVIFYSIILKEMKIESKFADQIYWRLIGEPLSLLGEAPRRYTPGGTQDEGSMEWRINKAIRDSDVFFKQKNSAIFFGFGYGGYSNIGEITYIDRGHGIRKPAHNFYTNLISEIGIVGLFLFWLFSLSLLFYGLKKIREGKLHFSLVYLLIYKFIYTIGGGSDLTDEFGYLLFGCIIAEYINAALIENKQVALQN